MGLTQAELNERKVFTQTLASLAAAGAAVEVTVGSLPFGAYLAEAYVIPEAAAASDDTNFIKVEIFNKGIDGLSSVVMATATSKATAAVGTAGKQVKWVPWTVGSELQSSTAVGVGSLVATPVTAPANLLPAFASVNAKVTAAPGTVNFGGGTLVLVFTPAPTLANQKSIS